MCHAFSAARRVHVWGGYCFIGVVNGLGWDMVTNSGGWSRSFGLSLRVSSYDTGNVSRLIASIKIPHGSGAPCNNAMTVTC